MSPLISNERVVTSRPATSPRTCDSAPDGSASTRLAIELAFRVGVATRRDLDARLEPRQHGAVGNPNRLAEHSDRAG